MHFFFSITTTLLFARYLVWLRTTEADKAVTRKARQFSATVNILFIPARISADVATKDVHVNSWLFFPRELVIKSFITDRLPIKLRPLPAEYIKDVLMNNLTTQRGVRVVATRPGAAIPGSDHRVSRLDNLFCIFRPAYGAM